MVDDALVGLDQVATDQLVRILCGPGQGSGSTASYDLSAIPIFVESRSFFLLVRGLIYLGGRKRLLSMPIPG